MSIYGSLLASELIASVKRRASIPDSQIDLNNQDILDICNEELMDSVVPQILQFHEEFFTYIKDMTLVANQSTYKIPYRAIGRKIRDLKYRDNTDDTGTLYNMTRILPEDRAYFKGGFTPYKAYYFQGDEIVVIPSVGPTPVGELVVDFFMRPNKIVLESRCSVITAINTSTGVITVDAIPTNLLTGEIDFVEVHPGHRLLGYDIIPTNVDALNLRFTVSTSTDGLTKLAVGDYICSAGESPVAQIPSELQSLLAERGAARCLASLGHQENLEASNQKIAELEQKSGSLIDNRSDGQPIKLNNVGGLLRQSKISRRGWY